MSSFPPSRWEVRYLTDMPTMSCSPREDGGPAMAAYLAARPSGGEEGTFRFALAGPDKIKLRFAVTDVLPSCLFEGMVAESEMDIGDQIKFEKNTVCSDWVDLLELVRSQDVMITNSEDEDLADEFLANIEKYKKELVEETGKTDRAGICIRWALGTWKDDRKIILISQVRKFETKL